MDDGIRAGRFQQRSTTTTADALLGSVVQWMRSRLSGDSPADRDDEEALAMVLAIVGVPPDEIGEVVVTVG